MKGGLIMEKTLAVAKYLNELNLKKYGCNMSEMKMHKMMYFSQRESLIVNDNPLFDSEFEAWRYSPVLTDVRAQYSLGLLFKKESEELSADDKKLVSDVYERYSRFSAWDLSTLSHSELSWKQAREGLRPEENCNKKMSLSAMRVDAKREVLKRKGVVLA